MLHSAIVIVTLCAGTSVAAASWPAYSAMWTTTASGATATLTATAAPGGTTDRAYLSLQATITTVSNNAVRLLVDAAAPLQDNQTMPYRVPTEVFNPPQAVGADSNQRIGYNINITTGAITFFDNRTGNILFSTDALQFGTNHLNFTARVDTMNTFMSGYGEHEYYYFINRDVREGRENSVTLSLWNTDNGTPWMIPMYGIHPVVFVANPAVPSFHAIALVNSNAQQLRIDQSGLHYYTIGGRLDVTIITADTMLEVIQQYHLLITQPAYVPPYWSLGMNQCRWGYKNLTILEEVVANYTNANLPLEVIWSDIDYMDRFRIFTTDPVNFPADQLQVFVDALHQADQRYVQIIDPGVAFTNYSVFNSGQQNGVYVNTSVGSPLVNAVWPGWTVFPDFTSDRVGDWWKDQLRTYRQQIPIDGVWLDMNELGTFCSGACDVTLGQTFAVDWLTVNWTNLHDVYCPAHCSPSSSPLNHPDPTPLTNGWPLAKQTLDMTGVTSMGQYYDTKGFYGFMEELQTNKALTSLRPEERPFLLSRASFVGSGRYTSHWTGDNNCNWEPHSGGIADSVQGCLAANLWGITHIGADIGGYSGTPEQQLVTRWMQLGAFYTFMRNHHALDNNTGQEPYRFAPEAVDTMRTAILWRYQLLPYMFTELVKSHYFGGPVMRHPSVNFPTDLATYHETTTFMLGDSLLVIPVVTPNTTRVSGYVPSGMWYRLRPNGTDVAVVTGGSWLPFASAVYGDTIPVLVKAGTALPVHSSPAETTTATRRGGVSLWCLLDTSGAAIGEAFFGGLNEAPFPADATDAYHVIYSCAGNRDAGIVTSSIANGASVGAPPDPGTTAKIIVRFMTATSVGW
jgi:alpha-glucosidase